MASSRLAPALALCCLVGVFLWTPLSSVADRTWTTADLLQDYLLTRVTKDYEPGNRNLSDPVTQMQPWTQFSKESLARGELPLWNPYNAAGQPLLANWQSGVFSIFNVPQYLLGLKAGLLARGALILGLLAWFTWLFLREIGLSSSASAVGACVFAFCGHNVLLLAYPHPGGAVALPAGLFFVERAVRAAVAGRKVHGACAALAVTLGLALLAGHPEPVFFACALVFAYALWRIFSERRRVAALPLLGGLALSAAVGMCIGLVQVLPFLEYAQNSSIARVRKMGHVTLSVANWPLWFFPDLLGSPAGNTLLRNDLPKPNYEAANTIYVGATALFAMLLAVPFVRKDSRIPFFLVVVLAWYAVVQGLPGMVSALSLVPGLSLAPLNRSQIIGAFCTAALAACAVDDLRSHAGRGRWWIGAAIAAAGGLLILVARRGADRLLEGALAPMSEHPTAFEHRLPVHLWTITASFLVALLALALLPVARRAWVQALAAAAVVAAVFVQTGWNWRDYNSTSPDELVFPQTPQTRALKEHVGESSLLVLGNDKILPEANMSYGLRQISSYDALGLWPLDNVVQIGLASRDNWRSIQSTRLHLLEYFGVQYVLGLGDWPTIETLMPPTTISVGRAPIAVDIEPGHVLTQEFVFNREGLRAVMIQLGTRPARPRAVLGVALEDAESGEVLAAMQIDSHTFQGGFDNSQRVIFPNEVLFPVPTRPLLLHLEPRPDSANHRYRIRLSSTGGRTGEGWCAWRTADSTVSAEVASLDGQALPERLLFDASAILGGELVKVADIGAYRLWRLKNGLGRAWIVHKSRAFYKEEDSLGKMLSGSLPPYEGVVLIGEERRTRAVGTVSAQDRIETLEDRARRRVYDVDTLDGGYLVLALPWYPGWRAKIDDARAPLARANYAFQALKLPPGPHRVVVEYEPQSVRIGLLLTILGAVGSAAWLCLSFKSSS